MHSPLNSYREIPCWANLDSPRSGAKFPLTLFQVGVLQVSMIVEHQTRCPAGDGSVWSSPQLRTAHVPNPFHATFQTSVGAVLLLSLQDIFPFLLLRCPSPSLILFSTSSLTQSLLEEKPCEPLSLAL